MPFESHTSEDMAAELCTYIDTFLATESADLLECNASRAKIHNDAQLAKTHKILSEALREHLSNEFNVNVYKDLATSSLLANLTRIVNTDIEKNSFE